MKVRMFVVIFGYEGNNFLDIDNDGPTTTLYVLNVKLGYRDDQLALVVQDEECSFFELDSKVKKFTRDFPAELWGSEITCQLFIDETVSCEYTFRLIDCVKNNNLRRVNFITLAKEYDPNTDDFYGLPHRFPSAEVRIVEE